MIQRATLPQFAHVSSGRAMKGPGTLSGDADPFSSIFTKLLWSSVYYSVQRERISNSVLMGCFGGKGRMRF